VSSGQNDQPSGQIALRLHHFFVLTAVMAVLLAINGPQHDVIGGKYVPSPLFRAVFLVVGITHTVLSAIALTAIGYGIAHARSGGRFFHQPGHWLLFDISLSALLYIVPSLGTRWLNSRFDPAIGSGLALSYAMMGYMLFVLVLGHVVVNVYLGFTKCRERRWKSVFFAKALGNLLFGIGGLVIIPVTVYACLVDRRQSVERDSAHWCGVLLQFATSGLSLIGGTAIIYGLFNSIFKS
jgi:hypothetical protein